MIIHELDGNKIAIGEGIDETGIAEETVEPGDVVEYKGDKEWGHPSAEAVGVLGVVLNQYPGFEEQDEFEEDDPILVRVHGAVRKVTAGENINAGEKLVADSEGTVQPFNVAVSDMDEDDVDKIFAKARTDADEDEDLVMVIF